MTTLMVALLWLALGWLLIDRMRATIRVIRMAREIRAEWKASR